MAHYFDEDEELELEKPRQDTEVTLSWGALLGMGLGLLLICGLCFGLGYMVGHRGPAPAATSTASTQTSAPDQEPLQGSESVPKPSATEQAGVPPAAQANETAPAAPSGAGQSPESATPNAAQGTQGGAPGAYTAPSTSAPPTQPQVRPALGESPAEAVPNAAPPIVRSFLPSPTSLMVQVAAVRNDEDANVLMNALRRRG
jgi:DedD protein